jgi:hypothetical protein
MCSVDSFRGKQLAFRESAGPAFVVSTDAVNATEYLIGFTRHDVSVRSSHLDWKSVSRCPLIS